MNPKPTNLKQLEENFLLIDFEGYFHFNNFFIKEFGFFEFGSIKTLNVKTKPLNFKNYHWLVSHYHRIPYDFGSVSFYKVLEILNRKNKIILVKGEEKAKITRKLTKNLVLNLENFDCPSFDSLTSDTLPCVYHSIVPTNHCVKLKISKLLNWLKHESRIIKISDRFVKDISETK
jgi:hypothetical protein